MSTATGQVTSRQLVGVLALTQTVGYGAMTMGFPVLLEPMQSSLHASQTAITAAATISVLVGALVAVPIGRWLDDHGGRWPMVGGSLLGVVAVLAWSRVHSVLALDLVFVAIGLALAASTYETAFAVVVVVTDRAERDRCLLLLSMMTAFAAAFFYPLTGWLDQLLGWRGALVALAALMAVIAIPGHLWVVPNAATHRARVTRTLGRSIGDALRDRHFWLLSAAFVIEAGAGSAVTVQLVSFLRHEGHSAEVSATVPMLIGVLSVPIRLCLGTAGRRFGMVAVTAAAFAIQALGAGVLWFTARSIVWTAVSIAAFGFGVAVATLSRPAIFADRYGPARYAGIISVTALMIGVSRAVAPLAASTLGDGQFLLWASGASVLSAAMLMFAGRSRSEQETSDDKTTDAACEDIYS